MVEKGLLTVAGVETASVDFKTGEARVSFDRTKTTPGKIVAAFNRANGGFRVQTAKAAAK
jgi:copper chaperone CopZ